MVGNQRRQLTAWRRHAGKDWQRIAMRDRSDVESAIKGSPRRDWSRMAGRLDQLAGAIQQSGQDGRNR